MSTYTLISSQVLSTSAASVTFSSIPQTYKDLVLRVSARSDGATTGDYFIITINGNTGSIYSNTEIQSYNGTSVLSANEANVSPSTANYNVTADAANNTASTFASIELYIPNYTASTNKPFSQFGVKENNTSNIANVTAVASLFSSSAAITSLSFAPISPRNWVTGSSFYLYGI
jgi:hypothetical protein